jgi:hypothetical protein
MGPWYWTVFSWHLTGTVPLYFAFSPLLLVLPGCHFYAQDQSEATTDTAASRLRLISVTSPNGAKTTVDEVWDVVEQGGEFEPGILYLFVLYTAEVASLVGFIVVVMPGSSLSLVQFTPSYIADNPHCTMAIGIWCWLYQCMFIICGSLFGKAWEQEVSGKLKVLRRVVTCCPPIIDFTCPENVVAWCRLRDQVALHAGQSVEGKSATVVVAKVSVAWAVLSALASIALTIKGAARTPYRIGCAWFGLIGGATAIVQLMCLTGCDREVAAQAAMLESQLRRVQQSLVMHDRLDCDGDRERDASTQQLRTAASLLQADLNSYRSAPEHHYYHLFGFPATVVLKSLSGFVASQIAVYTWNYLQAVSISSDGSGSLGLLEGCQFFMELEGC